MNKKNQINFDFSKISFNGGLFVHELLNRGVKVAFVKDTRVILANYFDHKELFYDIHTNLINYPSGWIINDKFFHKKWLHLHKIKTAPGYFFPIIQKKEILNYAKNLGFPIVLKPTVGSHGDNVYTDITTIKDLSEKIEIFKEKNIGNGYCLVEKQVQGNEYRLFISRRDFFAAVNRIPANVIGDGKSNLLSLIQRENFRRMNPRKNCLCEIRLDDITFDFMEKKGLTLDHIPKNGQKVFLRGNSNVSTGGNCYDVTDDVHPSVFRLAKKILLSFPRLPFIGVDLICPDIKHNINQTGYFVCELNSAPGLSLHLLPEVGKPREVVKELADLLFPET
jgi:cyanophycin synthetase